MGAFKRLSFLSLYIFATVFAASIVSDAVAYKITKEDVEDAKYLLRLQSIIKDAEQSARMNEKSSGQEEGLAALEERSASYRDDEVESKRHRKHEQFANPSADILVENLLTESYADDLEGQRAEDEKDEAAAAAVASTRHHLKPIKPVSDDDDLWR